MTSASPPGAALRAAARSARHGPGGGRRCREGGVQFGEDPVDVLADGLLGDHQLGGDGGVGAALGHQGEDLALAGGEPVDGLAARRRAMHLATTSGSRTVPPARTRRTPSTNSRDVGDPVLEQVADARPRRSASSVAGVGVLDVLREHQDRGTPAARARTAIAARRPSSVCVGGIRTSTHGAVRPRARRARSARSLAVVDGRDDREAVALEELDQAGAQEGVVLGEDKTRTGPSRVDDGRPAGRGSRPSACRRRLPGAA